MIWVFLILFLLFSCAPRTGDINSLKWQYNYDLGMSSYMAKNYSEAIANFYKASQLAPNEPKVWNALGLAYTEVQEYQKAETAYLKALEIDKKYTEAKMNLGILYFKQ
ncbi:MAG: tetratricopeptide repeat protein, partial [Aquificaceae bacterium]|nr:tetratricopeptide repeat protein [Aquificaceae bacterium]